MTRLTNLNNLAKEICDREVSDGREINITEAKRVLRHLADIIGEEWRLNFGFKITNALRASAQKRWRRKYVKSKNSRNAKRGKK